MTETIAIIGAGLAGLSAARSLAARGLAVHLFDKGRAPGGRLATRRAEHGGRRLPFDHGAQYLRAAGPDFAAALAEAGAGPRPDAARRVGVPAMSALPRAPGAFLVQHWDAAEAQPGAPPPLSAPAEDGPFSAVLVTPPAPRDAAAGRANFAVVLMAMDSLDWLLLAHEGHRRARFRWEADGTLSAGWVAP